MQLPLSLTPKQLKLAGLALLALVLLYYVVVKRPCRPYAIYLLAEKDYEGLETGFVQSWANARRAEEPTFEFNGKFYLTPTGTAQR